FARLSDWWCAGRDGRLGVPAELVPAGAEAAQTPYLDLGPSTTDAGARWATPHTVLLSPLGRGRAEKEGIRYQAEIADYLVQLTQVKARRESALRILRATEERLANLAEPTPEELRARVSGEEHTDEAIRVGRRMREFTERHRLLETELNQAR